MIGNRWMYLLLLSALVAPARSQDGIIAFHFVNPGLPVPDFTLTIHEDGRGTYTATYIAPPPDSRYGPSYVAANATPATTKVTQAIVLTPATTAQLFERVRSTDHFHNGCESKARNIANTGAKTISYTGPDGTAQCTYNYSENKAVAGLTDTFQGIAATLDEGRTLDLKHKYDRLGLDREMAALIDAIHEGRAVEVATIAPVLQSLRDDPQVMERVRKRAAGLLEANPPPH